MSGDTDRLARIEQAESIYADGFKQPWVLVTEEDRDALVKIVKAAREVAGYGEDLQPVWQLGAGQDWTEWRNAKERLRAALSALDGDT